MSVCASCGKDNQTGYRFCAACGAPLDAEGAPLASPAPSDAEPPAGEPPADSLFGPKPERLADMLASVFNTSPGTTPREEAGDPGETFDDEHDRPTVERAAVSADDSSPAQPPAPAAISVCGRCGSQVPADYAFCGRCGSPIAQAPRGVVRAVPAPSPARAAPRTEIRGRLVLMRPDGSEGAPHTLHEGENIIGRGYGKIFDGDGYLSPRHAELLLSARGLLLRDLASLNGVYVRITKEEELQSGDVFRIGQEILRFERIAPPELLQDGTAVLGSPNPGYWGRVSLVMGRDHDGSAYPLGKDAVVLGRERGDILFPEDGYVSASHARLAQRAGRSFLADLGSSNGTFLRLRTDRLVPSGTLILMGQQLFKATYSGAAT